MEGVEKLDPAGLIALADRYKIYSDDKARLIGLLAAALEASEREATSLQERREADTARWRGICALKREERDAALAAQAGAEELLRQEREAHRGALEARDEAHKAAIGVAVAEWRARAVLAEEESARLAVQAEAEREQQVTQLTRQLDARYQDIETLGADLDRRTRERDAARDLACRIEAAHARVQAELADATACLGDAPQVVLALVTKSGELLERAEKAEAARAAMRFALEKARKVVDYPAGYTYDQRQHVFDAINSALASPAGRVDSASAPPASSAAPGAAAPRELEIHKGERFSLDLNYQDLHDITAAMVLALEQESTTARRHRWVALLRDIHAVPAPGGDAP